MALQNLVGAGLWLPIISKGLDGLPVVVSQDTALLDADEEEFQMIGTVHIDGGGSKTFGTSGSKIAWLPGASITFLSGSTVRVGVKKSTTIDSSAGPASRATIGAAAFDVYDDLVGGTDTITSTTWREDAMSAGTPFTVADGDEICIAWHLDTSSGSPSVKIRTGILASASNFATATLVTSGPTYTTGAHLANFILVFDDGTIGWIEPTYPFTVAETVSGTIGNGNIFGNVFRVPFKCKVDAIAAAVFVAANTSNFALELYSTPLGTPALIESVAHDSNKLSVLSSARLVQKRLTTPRELTVGTDYAVGVKQTTAGAITILQRDVDNAAHFKASGLGAECYAANSTAAATFAAQNSGKRRYNVWVRLSALDDGVQVGAGMVVHPGMNGRLI